MLCKYKVYSLFTVLRKYICRDPDYLAVYGVTSRKQKRIHKLRLHRLKKREPFSSISVPQIARLYFFIEFIEY